MSPARLLVELYDRLLLDLDRGGAAIESGAVERAHVALAHAREIVAELLSALDLDAWSAAAQLAAVYRFVIAQLETADGAQDGRIVSECRGVIEPLRDAWRSAAGIVGSA
jgi:flagellar protein FliS